jgi:radical SAM superfamily enzyme YgiQ (UPF0313 family)
VYRPPSEASSLLIQATEGCTYRCTFCVSNIGKKFKVRAVEEIKHDIDTAVSIYGKDVRRVFFLDGNAMVMPYDQLLEIAKYTKKIFSSLQRISVYAHAKDILAKTDEQLLSLSEAGLKMVYIGIETGNDDLLKNIRKQQTSDDIVEAFHKCFKTGITPSGTIILGLAGNNKDISYRHMKDTATLVNRASPTHVIKGEALPVWYISCLALMISPGTPIHKEIHEGKLIPMNADEILYEMKIFIEHISDEVQHCIFRSNHASNYLALKGNLSRDKDKILEVVGNNLQNRDDIRPEYLRAL